MKVLSKKKRDYYDVLGVSKDSDIKTIKKAFRKLARKYHPDMKPDDPNAEEKFKEAAEAFEVLSDKDKRVTYDRFGHAGLSGTQFRDFSGMGFEDLFSGFGIFGDLFSAFGGGSRARTSWPRAQRGQDVRLNLELSFEEAMRGLKKKIRVPNWAQCPTCHGARVKQGESMKNCKTCQGTGEIRHIQRSAFGQIVNISTCPQCHGEGKSVPRGAECEVCGGLGKVKQFRSVSAEIPAGVDDGMRVVIQGEGRPGELGGPPGDLFIVLSVEPHPFFRRNGADILLEYPIGFIDAILGTKVEVPTIDGKETIIIKPGTESGKIITLRNKGAPYPNSSHKGDMHIGIVVKFPSKLTKSSKKLLKELEKTIDKKYVFEDSEELVKSLSSSK
ncbi:MAG: molecular chaperone DnaJ [Candidatus Heimdallarchaeota archaeon]|nr:MAG: molecular chaperone DnaJ [Candidatus Heimdallarchaeota archaeon]